jgi:hypothetical protein
MFWIIVVAVLVVGFAAAWWQSGRARPLKGDRDRDRHLVEGQVENYRPQGNAPTHNFRL